MSRLMRKVTVLSCMILALCDVAHAASDMKKLFYDVIFRYEGETQISKLSMTTCSYQIENNKVACSSTPRHKTLQSVVKRSGEKFTDSKGFTLILQPLAEAGISILQYDYYQTGKSADQWLYMPEIGDVKRVASPADTPKAGSLFGSEFALEDMERPKIENYELSLLKETDYDNHPVIMVEQKPTPKHSKKTNYSKHILWIDSQRLLILKHEFYAWNGELIKTNYSSNIEQIDGIWTVQKSVMMNVKTKRISVMVYDDVNYNQQVPDDMLTQRMLSDAVFQKTKLQSLLQTEKHSGS